MFANLAALVAGADPQLVDLRFGHVGSLLGVVQLVLELPVLGQVGVGLFLLWGANGEDGLCTADWRGELDVCVFCCK